VAVFSFSIDRVGAGSPDGGQQRHPEGNTADKHQGMKVSLVLFGSLFSSWRLCLRVLWQQLYQSAADGQIA
jgi:hypothetical protein